MNVERLLNSLNIIIRPPLYARGNLNGPINEALAYKPILPL